MSFGHDWIPSLSCQQYSSPRRSSRHIASEQLGARSIRMMGNGCPSSLLQAAEENTAVERVFQYLVLCQTKAGPCKDSSVSRLYGFAVGG
jgi:hypothetical protein